MKKYDKLIFVSNDGTCRGPMAVAAMKSKFLLEDLVIAGKGWVVLFPEPINQKAEVVLVSHGLTMKEYMSEQLCEEDFEERTLILTLDEVVKQKIIETHQYVENVFLLTDYAGHSGEIPNPIGGSLADYGECFETIEAIISKLVVILNEQELLT